MAEKPEGKDEFTQKVGTGSVEPRTTNVEEEVRAMGISTAPIATTNENQGGN
jgi:hypothetical protein